MRTLFSAGLLGLLLLLFSSCSKDREFTSLDETLSVNPHGQWVWAYDIKAPYDIKIRHVPTQTLFLISTIEKQYSPSQILSEVAEIRCVEFIEDLGCARPQLTPVELVVDSMSAVQFKVPYSVEGQDAYLVDTTIDGADAFYRMLGLVSQKHFEKMVPALDEVIASFRVDRKQD